MGPKVAKAKAAKAKAADAKANSAKAKATPPKPRPKRVRALPKALVPPPSRRTSNRNDSDHEPSDDEPAAAPSPKCRRLEDMPNVSMSTRLSTVPGQPSRPDITKFSQQKLENMPAVIWTKRNQQGEDSAADSGGVIVAQGSVSQDVNPPQIDSAASADPQQQQFVPPPAQNQEAMPSMDSDSKEAVMEVSPDGIHIRNDLGSGAISLDAIVRSCTKLLDVLTGDTWTHELDHFGFHQLQEDEFTLLMSEAKGHVRLAEHIADVHAELGPDADDWTWGSEDGNPLEDLLAFIRFLTTVLLHAHQQLLMVNQLLAMEALILHLHQHLLRHKVLMVFQKQVSLNHLNLQ